MKKIVITFVVLFFGTNLTFAQAKDSLSVSEFSPNGDGVKDVFEFNAINFKNVKIEIYDMNSNLIFKSSDFNAKWDGKNLVGKSAVEGVYLFEQGGEGNDGKLYSHKGKINLKR